MVSEDFGFFWSLTVCASLSLDLSLLSPDSSYVCYSSADGGDPCCCRRSPRLLTNGYYSVTEDSFSWDEDGNVSLTPCKTSVSYKENLVSRGWMRKSSEACSGQGQNQNQLWDGDLDRELDRDKDQDWARTSQEGPAPLDETSWSGFNSTELDDSCSFTYDHTEIPPPPDKEAPPRKLLIQEEICSEICQSKERFTQSLGGLSEVPPPSPFYTSSCCCQASPEHTGLTMKALLLFVFTIFIFTALCSG
ncbi:hypothetical protein L3Q82_021107 [Scortum barcoo]|uniref:Uncharacterized protein n=1 Tax=Scortum barcoo TaxID=214431 RepID=A0ACB8X3F5_9TELE|nr:hypothetical protein L3Q82_021107 [Scortum barcoo]